MKKEEILKIIIKNKLIIFIVLLTLFIIVLFVDYNNFQE